MRLPPAIDSRSCREHRGQRALAVGSPLGGAASKMLLSPAPPKQTGRGCCKPSRESCGSSMNSNSSSSASTRAPTADADSNRGHVTPASAALSSEAEAKVDGIKQALLKLYEKKKRSNHTAGLAMSQRRWSRVAEDLGNMKLLWAKEKVKEFEFFQQLPLHVQEQLLDVVYYSKLAEGTPLFIQGDKPGVDDLGESYIVLSGEVAIWVAPSSKSSKQPASASQAQEQKVRGTGSTSLEEHRMSRASMMSYSVASDDEDDDGNESVRPSEAAGEGDQEESWGNHVASVHAGTLLGHLALLRQQPRNATCVASVETEVLVIRKMDFMRVLKDYVDVMKDIKAEFLSRHIPGLTKLSSTKSEYALHNFEKKAFERDFVFYEQATIPREKAVYVLAKGAVEVSAEGHKVGVLVPGAVFGSVDHSMQHFTLSAAHQSSVEVYQVRGKDVLKLPHSLRQDIMKHIRQTQLWHQLRLKETLPQAPPAASAASACRPGSSASSAAGRLMLETGGRRMPTPARNLSYASDPQNLMGFLDLAPQKEIDLPTAPSRSNSRPGSSAGIGQRRGGNPAFRSPAGQAAAMLTQQGGTAQRGLNSSSSLPSLSRQGSSSSNPSGTDSQRTGPLSAASSRASSSASSRNTKARAHEVLRRLRQMD